MWAETENNQHHKIRILKFNIAQNMFFGFNEIKLTKLKYLKNQQVFRY